MIVTKFRDGYYETVPMPTQNSVGYVRVAECAFETGLIAQ